MAPSRRSVVTPRRLLTLLLVLVAASFGAGVAAPQADAATPCWKRLINDWYDGRIDRTYPAQLLPRRDQEPAGGRRRVLDRARGPRAGAPLGRAPEGQRARRGRPDPAGPGERGRPEGGGQREGRRGGGPAAARQRRRRRRRPARDLPPLVGGRDPRAAARPRRPRGAAAGRRSRELRGPQDPGAQGLRRRPARRVATPRAAIISPANGRCRAAARVLSGAPSMVPPPTL